MVAADKRILTTTAATYPETNAVQARWRKAQDFCFETQIAHLSNLRADNHQVDYCTY